MSDSQIPPEAYQRIKDFLAARKTGRIELHVKEGRLLSWAFTEHGRAAKDPDQPHNGTISRY